MQQQLALYSKLNYYTKYYYTKYIYNNYMLVSKIYIEINNRNQFWYFLAEVKE